MLFIRFMFIIIVLMAAGCSSIKFVDLHHQADINFNDLTTYSLFERSSAFTEQQNINHSLRNGIELAIENTFDEHNFRYKEADSADVMIAYALTGLPVLKPFNYTNSNLQCAYCLNEKKNNEQLLSNGKSPQQRTRRENRQRTQQLYEADNDRDIGALVIDILDRKTLRTLWEGEYPLGVDLDDSSREVQDKVQEALDELMKYYSKHAVKK